jgi:hypothetical protein
MLATPDRRAEHRVKVRDCLATRLEPVAVEAVIGHARRIDALDAVGVRRLKWLVGCFA